MQFRFSNHNPKHPISSCRFDAMHTRIEMLFVGLAEKSGEALADEIHRVTKDMERRFNRFDMRSPLSMLNSRAAAESVGVDDELYMALELCEVFRVATKGYFSVAPSSLMAKPYSLEPATHSVKFINHHTLLDMGGFAKGFALEQVIKLARQNGVESGLVNFGNSSIASIGHHPYGEWWQVGVENPERRGEMACEVHLCDSAISVSGRAPSGEYHIVNPHTGARVAQDELILVEGRSALVAEILSTALYAAPSSEREAILKQFEGYSATEILCSKSGVAECRKI